LSIKKIYLVRHGQTDYNLRGIVQGSGVDASLNEKGKAQAAAFYQKHGAVPFDKVYTSCLKRSIESVELFLKNGLPHGALEGLNEINWGSREGMVITPEEDAYYYWVLRQWQLGNTQLRIEGGDSPEDVVMRQASALSQIMAQTEEKNILICMHGRAMRILLCTLLRYPLRCMDFFTHGNLSLYQITFTGTLFQLTGFNDRSHLSENLL
jgi:broad specificity phosphatase PhoE